MKMRRRSVKTHTIVTMSSAMTVIFLIFFLSFNLLFGSFIRRDAWKDFKEIQSNLSDILRNDTPEGLEQSETRFQEIIKKLQKIAKTRLVFSQQEFILTDRKLQVIFPRKQSEGSITNEDAQKIMTKINTDRPFKNRLSEVKAGNRHYYALMIPLKPGTGDNRGYLVLLSDVSGLNNFKNLVNKVLLLSALLTGGVALVIIIISSTRLVNAIKKLCQFARKVGEGDFANQTMNFKETELQALSDDMNRMASRLSDQDTQQKIFFQNISHEFKTPLMSIQGYAESIKYGITENKEKACDIISHECTRLSDMVSDLLFISRFESREDTLQKKRINIKSMLTDCCDGLIGAAQKLGKEISLNLPTDDVFTMADEEKLVMAVSNLISNCIRHADTQISVSLSTADKALEITVSDNGKGFDEKDLPNLFKRFYKGKNGSSGLGLSIAQAIVEAHGGTLSAKNIPTGAQFEITLERTV